MKNIAIVILLLVISIIVVGFSVYKVNNEKNNNKVDAVQITPRNSTVINNKPTEKVFRSTISLTVTQPTNGLVTASSTILVKGITLPYADVAVNDSDLKADNSGAFSVSIKLDEGDNVIAIIANDDQGNVAEKEITVTYTP
jgi:hypothetical protein